MAGITRHLNHSGFVAAITSFLTITTTGSTGIVSTGTEIAWSCETFITHAFSATFRAGTFILR
jgi:hypothetical protein